jgi:hypothetical protein
MKLFYLHSEKIKPVKHYGDEILSYPNIKKFTSHCDEVTTIHEFYDSLIHRASSGEHVLLKGLLKRDLEQESRAGATSREMPTEWMVFDIDGTELKEVDAVLERIGLSDYSHIIQYSSSYGVVRNGEPIKQGLRAHVYFMLRNPISPTKLKDWFKYLNLEHFERDMELTGAGYSLTWPLDPSVAENSKLIYIAPAVCNPPFEDRLSPDQRIQLVERQAAIVPSTFIHSPSAAVLRTQQEKIVLSRRKADGRSSRRMRMINLGSNLQVIANADPGSLHYVTSQRGYCYYNLNNGDSVAYYHPQHNPDVMYSFKPEDPPFRHSDVDPQSYSDALERAEQYKRERGEVIRGVGRDPVKDEFFSYAYDPKTNTVQYQKIDKGNMADHLANYGLVVPDPVPDFHCVFDPTDDRCFDFSNRWINHFSDNEFGRRYRGIGRSETLNYEGASVSLDRRCPYIAALMNHVLGKNTEVMNWTLNWLAHIVQVRTKPGTALVIHGVPGTGKNVFMEQVIRPLVSREYYIETRMDMFSDKMTGWMDEKRIIVINEANEVAMTGDGSKIGEMLKNIITESRLGLRHMYSVAGAVDTYFAVIVASNNEVPIVIDQADRRFTIAYKQHSPLLTIGDYNVKKDFHKLAAHLESELDAFAEFLYEFPIDPEMVATALDNAPRASMILSGKTSVDEFCDAIKGGDLDYFLEAIPDVALQTTFSTTVLTVTNANKLTLQRFISNVNNEITVSADQLRLMYMMITNQTNVSPVKFGKMLSKHGVYLKPGQRVGSQRCRGIRITWSLYGMTPDEAWQIVKDAWGDNSFIADQEVPEFLQKVKH